MVVTDTTLPAMTATTAMVVHTSERRTPGRSRCTHRHRKGRNPSLLT